jgi:hypothetical protein
MLCPGGSNKNGECIAANPRQCIVRSDLLPYVVRNLAQHHVPRSVPQIVINPFEPVEIDKKTRQLAFALIDLPDFFAKGRFKPLPVQ